MHPHLKGLDPLARAWRSRAGGEARVGRSFARLAAAMPAGEAVPLVRDGLLAAAEEEARHARLCDEMAAEYGGPASTERPLDEPMPLDTELGRLLVLVSACCISESIASAYLEHCFAAARDPRARELFHALLTDEVGHAQLGWAHVAGLAPRLVPELTRALPTLIARTRQAWSERIRQLHEYPAPEHGYPVADGCVAVVDEAVAGLVVRGFQHVGIAI